MNFNMYKIVVILFVLLNIFFCKKEEVDFSDLYEIIYLRYKQVDMFVYVYGNVFEKVFLIYLYGGFSGVGLEVWINFMIIEVEKNNVVVYFD